MWRRKLYVGVAIAFVLALVLLISLNRSGSSSREAGSSKREDTDGSVRAADDPGPPRMPREAPQRRRRPGRTLVTGSDPRVLFRFRYPPAVIGYSKMS